MSRWLATNKRGSVEVEGDSWLWAVARAQEPLEIPQSAYHDIFIEALPSGTVKVYLQDGERVLMVPLDDAAEGAEESISTHPLWTEALDLSGMPSDIAQKLPEHVRAIATSKTEQACHLAVESTGELLGCESASVLLEHEGQLRFVEARGPYAGRIMAYSIHKGKGLAGYVYSTGNAVLVNDVAQSFTHMHAIDVETGYRPKAVLAAAVEADETRLGVLELLDPKTPFAGWEIAVVRALGTALAQALIADEEPFVFG